MLSDFISKQILRELPYTPTEEQAALVMKLSGFIVAHDAKKAFLLQGYAGTGKTTVVSALVRALNRLEQKTVLLAPTGRAAKVLSNYSGFPAHTIHKKIYRQKAMGDFRFQLSDNLHRNALFIIDEASMISNTSSESSTFGSGRLLEDVIDFVYSGRGCSLLLLGDTAQLPPVEQKDSPALDLTTLKQAGLNLQAFTLTGVVRQALESGILYHATNLRMHLAAESTVTYPKFRLKNFRDIVRLESADMIDTMQHSFDRVGVEEAIVVTRSNKQANRYNSGIRSRVMMLEDELTNGDLLMVTRNNYFWNKPYPEIDFIANGEVLQVVRLRKHQQMYGFRFVDLTLRSLDYGWELDTRVWLDSLYAENPAEMNRLTSELFAKVAEDYPEITTRRALVRTVLENEYFNALQVKFAYAVTCHKAQGGQWKHVFIDHGYLPEEQIGVDYYRWLYTALTRATEQVYLINFPEKWFV